jgi:hypothetical protein
MFNLPCIEKSLLLNAMSIVWITSGKETLMTTVIQIKSAHIVYRSVQFDVRIVRAVHTFIL